MNSDDLGGQFLDQAPACSWIINQQHQFVRAAGDCVALFGVPPSKLKDRSLQDVLSDEALKRWQERMDKTLAGERLYLRERRAYATYYVQQFPIRCGEERFAGGFAIDVAPWSTADQELRHTVLGALRSQDFVRSSMAKFLHDSVGQNLSASGLQLDLLRMDLESTSPEAVARIGEIQQMLESVVEQVREFSYELNPSTVERIGLRPALDRFLGKVRPRFHGNLRMIFEPSTKVPPKYATAFFQIAQEAVENAMQHSGCSVIEIAVKSTKIGPSLEVRDNGRGFEPAAVEGGRRGLGLLTMEHFAAQAGLEVTVSSSRDTGTLVRVASTRGGTQ